MRTILGRFLALLVLCVLCSAVFGSEPVRLFVKEAPLKVLGKEVTVIAIEQEDGTQGYSPEKAEGFHVEVVNQLGVPTTIHWHGLVLPNLMDGVPFVTQNPILPGESFRYEFPLKQSGTYWMHSHYGLQEQLFSAAPMIIWTPEERAKADRQAVVMLTDFSFTPPEKILMGLKGATQMPGMTDKPAGKMDMESSKQMDVGTKDSPKMSGGMVDPPTAEVVAQKWDDQKKMFVRASIRAAPAEFDVQYDALLANRRTLDDPEIIHVEPGESVLLRLIAASSATNFYVDFGALEGEILAVDGKAVNPLKGNFFQLGIAQRLDVRVRIPKEGGAFPILAQGEGTKLLCGVVLAASNAEVPQLSRNASLSAAAMDNTQEAKLQAIDPLSDRKPDTTLPAVLSGDMAAYVWKINDAAYPNRNSLDIKKDERVGIVFTNATSMAHPMHFHGHDFQVVEIDGKELSGALRDTVVVPASSKITVAFNADNPGLWALHCHLIYHLVTGMFTVVKYDGAETSFWHPEKQAEELKVSE